MSSSHLQQDGLVHSKVGSFDEQSDALMSRQTDPV
jgi:hypothetical protein